MEIFSDDERQAMFASIIEGSEDAIISKNLESRVLSWNKAAERMFGYTEQEMIGELIYRIIPEERRHEEEEIISRLKAGLRIEHFETIRLTKSGKQLQISLTISPIRNRMGIIVGASKIARDITKQKQTEERLRIVSETGTAINAKLDVNDILQLVTDATTKIATAAFGAFFFNKVDAKGETYILYALSGAPRQAFEKFGMPRNTAIFKPTFDGVAIKRSDDITKDPDFGKNAPHYGMPKGHLPVVSYLAIPVISPAGKVVGGLFFGHPEKAVFTEEHQRIIVAIATQAAIALENAKLYEEVNHLNKRKDEFIGFASHELKTPLTTIKGFLQLAREGSVTMESIYDKLDKQVHRLEGIIAELLDISKIQVGKLDVRFENTSLHAILQESVESILTNNHTLEVEQPAQDIQVFADRQKISQVIVNLLTNAVKYSNPGTTIRIVTEVIGNDVKVSVYDQGFGIPPKHLEEIFNPFYRVQNNASRVQGMGLGLYLSKIIIEAHLGKIWAESEVGKGSAFHILFPPRHRED